MIPSISRQVMPRSRATPAMFVSFSQSIANASSKAVKRDPGSAHGTFNLVDAAFVAVGTGDRRNEDGRELHWVDVPPTALLRVE